MIYFDVSYIARLYFDDNGWPAVRALAAESALACSWHGYAETIAVIHRKFREGILSKAQYGHVLEQFQLDCEQRAYSWLPLSPVIQARLKKAYGALPPTVFLRASDAIHLACAKENHFREVYSNDQRLLAAATYFGIRGENII
jgi:predicted nucleic acid-binding protein